MEQSAVAHVEPEQKDIKLEHLGGGSGSVVSKPRRSRHADDDPSKRRCVSTACIACRKRKSKCDGNLPACAACSQVSLLVQRLSPTLTRVTQGIRRRKGVYKKDNDNVNTNRNSTLQTLVQALLNYSEEEAFDLVREIRSCESLDAVAERIVATETAEDDDYVSPSLENGAFDRPTFERQLYGKMGDLRLEEGTVRYIGGTSNLIHVNEEDDDDMADEYTQQENPFTSWTRVTDDESLVLHLLNMYFTWHYTCFTTLSKTLFFRDFRLGRPPPNTRRKTQYCTPLLVNAMLAVGCHFTSRSGARDNPDDPATAGDHFFREAKRLIMENDEHEKPRLATVQALALMSVREAGCAREAKGWVYSGMSFRMACDMGLHLNSGQLTTKKHVNGDDEEEDVRRITFWGCYLFDKCWSNYLGRLPQLPTSIVTAPKPEVFPEEDAAQWSPYTDSGWLQAHAQPARTRAVALQITKLCGISNDLMTFFYNPSELEKIRGKSAELKMLSSIHTRLEAWRRDLPKEMEPREGALPSILTMHMFFQLFYIHLFRPFLKYTQATSPLPQTVSPRKMCTQAAQMISKLMRLYKRSHGLRQICNITVYIAHAACTIHILNLPDRNAKRDIVHGVKHLEEIAEGWLCARRTLGILSVLVRKWSVELPEEASTVLARTDRKFGSYSGHVQSTDIPRRVAEMNPAQFAIQQPLPNAIEIPATDDNSFNMGSIPNTTTTAPLQPSVQAMSDNIALPPYDANNLQAQPQPSSSATPRDTGKRNAQPSGRKEGSPSDMFGGVEQLLRDSQDWVYQDSMQFANGFENWTGMDMGPSTWPNGVFPNDVSMGGGMMGGTSTAQMSMPNVQAPPVFADGNAGLNDYAGVEWLDGVNPYNSMAIYNEEEWYQ